MLLECLAHQRYGLLVDEACDGILDHALFFGQFRADVKKVERIEF